MGWGLPGILRYLPSPTFVPHRHLSDTLASLPKGARILDVGAGGRRISSDVVTVDAVPAPGVDIVGDIHNLPLDDELFDGVVCTGTLEHVADPHRAVLEMCRVLKTGGVIHIDVPFIQGYHADPTDYWRFTIDGLRFLCRPFQELSSGVHIGPSCGLVWIAREWADSMSGNRYLSNGLLVIVAVLTAPLKYLDYLALRSTKSHRAASALYFRGRKLHHGRRPSPVPVEPRTKSAP